MDPVNMEACHRLKLNHWPEKVIGKLVRKNDALEIPKGKKKLKTTDLSQKCFPPNTIFFINEGLCSYCTDFYGQNIKKYGPKNPLYHSRSQMGLFQLKKVRTVPQYWFHTTTTW